MQFITLCPDRQCPCYGSKMTESFPCQHTLENHLCAKGNDHI